MNDNLKSIIAFVQSAKSGSFSAAAEVLNVTPAAVSKHVSMLEKHLGVRLFNRTTRSLSLTAEGIVFEQQTRPALEMLENAADMVRSTRTELTGLVRMSTATVIGRNLVLPFIPELQARYPKLSLELDFNDRIIDFVKESYDFVLRGGVIEDSSLISRPVGPLKVALIAGTEYLNKYGTPKTVEELKAHRHIARRFLSGKTQVWHFKEQTFEPTNRVLTFSDPESVLDAARAGLGIAEVALYLAQAYIDSGEIKPILSGQHLQSNFQLAFQYPHRAGLAPRVRAVIDFLLERISKKLND